MVYVRIMNEAHMWWVSAVLCSILTAAFYTINQYYKLNGLTLVFWRGLIPFFVLTPVVMLIDWPQSSVFYAIVLVGGLAAMFSDSWQMRGSALYGGGVTTRMKPFTLWLVFLLWFIFSTEYRELLLSDIPKCTAIVSVFIVAVLSASHMNKCEVSRKAFVYFLPAIFASTLINILNKVAMDISPLLGGVVVYTWIEGGIIALTALAAHRYKKELAIRALFKTKAVFVGSIIGGVMVFQTLTKNFAMAYVLNPAYVSAIVFVAPFWVALFYRITGHRENVSIAPGLIFVLAAIAMVLLN